MARHQILLLVTAILLGWITTIALWLNPPTLTGDEAYYARVPVEMRERKDWVVPYFNGEPRYKKPPLMYWFVALSQSIFGENEFASRLPSFFSVVFTALLLVWFGFKVGIFEVGLWSAAAFLLNPMTAVLGNWGAPEATLCFFITASVLFGFLWLFNNEPLYWLLLSSVAAGLGILTKGAPGLVLPILVLLPMTIWKVFGQSSKPIGIDLKKSLWQFGFWFFLCLTVAAPWFVAIWLREGEKFWQVFLMREHFQRVAEPMEGHFGPIWFYLPIIWLLFMPWSICLPQAFVKAMKGIRQLSRSECCSFDFPMAWWAISVVVLFSLVATKLPHYIFPAFPAIAWLVALQLQRDMNKSEFLLGLILSLLPVPILFYFAFAGVEAYKKFLSEIGFKPGMELDALRLAAYTLLLGFASVPLIWCSSKIVFVITGEKIFAEEKSLLISGAIMTIVTLVSLSILMKASGGRNAVSLWSKSENIATFGSDTEWAIFYAKRVVPMLGRNQKKLQEFLANQRNAAILARIDFSPNLKHKGLKLKRFGIWCVAFSEVVESNKNIQR
ncbi:MAG: glycosyltransferase family 39 protein [Armatimonadetes bacterium]|nr:glycosyltransferase family 39 protein [Armatimonadota bacterium]